MDTLFPIRNLALTLTLEKPLVEDGQLVLFWLPILLSSITKREKVIVVTDRVWNSSGARFMSSIGLEDVEKAFDALAVFDTRWVWDQGSLRSETTEFIPSCMHGHDTMLIGDSRS